MSEIISFHFCNNLFAIVNFCHKKPKDFVKNADIPYVTNLSFCYIELRVQKVKKVAINNDRNLLEQQILSNSGLKGKELENLKARLATLSEQQLQAELSKSLSGNNKGEWYTGVMLEHSDSEVLLDNYDKITYTDDNGNEITDYSDGENVLQRVIKDEDGNEITVTYKDNKPFTQTKNINGNIEKSRFTYHEGENPHVTVETTRADRTKITTNTYSITKNGDIVSDNIIDKTTVEEY